MLNTSVKLFISVILTHLIISQNTGPDYAICESLHSGEIAETDSLTKQAWEEETYYRINILRLKRWVQENPAIQDDPVLSVEISQLLKEVTDFAAAGDFYMANVWMETIWDLIASWEISPSRDQSTFQSTGQVAYPVGALTQTPRFDWSREAITGVDLWRQEFNFRFLDTDSTYLEGSGNPFTGVRFNLDYANGKQTNLRGTTFFKYSRDYLTGEADLQLTSSAGEFVNWKLQNRLEGTSFFRDFNLKYLQNQSLARVDFRVGVLKLTAQDDFLLRSYAESDSAYPNYYINTFLGAGGLHFGMNSSFNLSYRNVVRKHGDFETNDYRENRLEVLWEQSIGGFTDFRLQNDFRVRDYSNVPAGHFFQDYWENYFWGNIDFKLAKVFGLELQGGVNKREYDFLSASSLPDFIDWEVEPELYLKPSVSWRISAGIHYERETHQNLVPRLNAVDAESAISIQFEDFYAVGPVLKIDFFNVNGFLLSLQESYLLRRYPNSPTNDVRDFNLFSDRNINSIIFFLNWSINQNWQFNLLANMDDDRSQKDDTGDSRNTIIGLELGYHF